MNKNYVCTAPDMDECSSIPGICRNGECENVIGSFICRCPAGFRLSQSGRECRGVSSTELSLHARCLFI